MENLPSLTLFRFTTIDPQRAIGYLQISCACARFGLSDRCKPNYGSCIDGRRSVPIELLDVAGLVPGAHEGKGLGNKFLDDLRHADALVHVVDVSGTTDAEGELFHAASRSFAQMQRLLTSESLGKATRGYDPSQDIIWLRSEITRWIEGNLVEKWYALTLGYESCHRTVLILSGAPSNGGISPTVSSR